MKKKIQKIIIAATLAAIFLLTASPALASDAQGIDPLTAIENVKGFLLNLIIGAGVILISIGILQLALSFQSHDPQQRSHAFMFLIGGFLCVGVRILLGIIGV